MTEAKSVGKYCGAPRVALAKAEDQKKKGDVDPKIAAALVAEVARRYRRSEIQSRSESKDVSKVEKELESEAKDRKILGRELKRAIAEIQSLKPS